MQCDSVGRVYYMCIYCNELLLFRVTKQGLRLGHCRPYQNGRVIYIRVRYPWRCSMKPSLTWAMCLISLTGRRETVIGYPAALHSKRDETMTCENGYQSQKWKSWYTIVVLFPFLVVDCNIVWLFLFSITSRSFVSWFFNFLFCFNFYLLKKGNILE